LRVDSSWQSLIVIQLTPHCSESYITQISSREIKLRYISRVYFSQKRDAKSVVAPAKADKRTNFAESASQFTSLRRKVRGRRWWSDKRDAKRGSDIKKSAVVDGLITFFTASVYQYQFRLWRLTGPPCSPPPELVAVGRGSGGVG